jgi:phosphopantetheinyl transferase (holo-ACP synthase)
VNATRSILTFDPAEDGSARLEARGAGTSTRHAGIDLLDVPRLGLAVSRTGPPLERRICTETERSGLPDDPQHRLLALARIFSVKESALKVLGGMPRGAGFHDLCTGDPHAPRAVLTLTGEAGRKADLLGVALLADSRPLHAGLLVSWAVGVPATAIPATAAPQEPEPAP